MDTVLSSPGVAGFQAPDSQRLKRGFTLENSNVASLSRIRPQRDGDLVNHLENQKLRTLRGLSILPGPHGELARLHPQGICLALQAPHFRERGSACALEPLSLSPFVCHLFPPLRPWDSETRPQLFMCLTFLQIFFFSGGPVPCLAQGGVLTSPNVPIICPNMGHVPNRDSPEHQGNWKTD